MLTTLAFLAALPLAPAQPGNLSLTGTRLNYGLHGLVRADNKVLPGDQVVIHFEIDNISVDKDGKAHYNSTLEVSDPSGKVIFTQPPSDLEVFCTLGGNTLPASASLLVGQEQAPGEYAVKITVTDTLVKKSATMTQKVQVLPKGFGFIGIMTSSDADGRHPAGVLSAGESLYINASVVGFARTGNPMQPKITVEMMVKDEQGKPTLPKPFTASVDKDVPEKATALPFQFLVSLNRPGKFTVELKATDEIGKKPVTVTIPFTVLPHR